MADVSALLAQYLSVKSQINYYQLEETKWAGLHEQMSAKLSKQTKAEDKWNSASDTAEDNCYKESQAVAYKGTTLKRKTDPEIKNAVQVQRIATSYANLIAPTYDPLKLEEYAELDMEYDLMQSTYETLLEQLNAQAEQLKSTLGNATKDTGMLDQ